MSVRNGDGFRFNKRAHELLELAITCKSVDIAVRVQPPSVSA